MVNLLGKWIWEFISNTRCIQNVRDYHLNWTGKEEGRIFLIRFIESLWYKVSPPSLLFALVLSSVVFFILRSSGKKTEAVATAG